MDNRRDPNQTIDRLDTCGEATIEESSRTVSVTRLPNGNSIYESNVPDRNSKPAMHTISVYREQCTRKLREGNRMSHADEISDGSRFEFGENWSRFLSVLDERRIELAERSLRDFLEVDRLDGKSFVDVGSGSGLFSLAARRLGARVHSFDYDPKSVACTAELRRRYFPGDSDWTVEQGSALDRAYLERLGSFDIVYSWGVLHHTGRMWDALGNVTVLTQPGGRLFIAIYNDQGAASKRWLVVKRLYNSMPSGMKWLILVPAGIRLTATSFLKDTLRLDPLKSWREYATQSVRGMDRWRDLIDWVGGLPFEVATPEEIFHFYRQRDFMLTRLRTCAGGLGCNEFVFERKS